MKKKSIIAGAAGIILIAVIIVIIAVRGRMTASTMRINEIEGTVILTDDSGRELTPSAGRRLQDGNVLDTEEDSKAVVELDDDRCVYMLEHSRARFNKSGKVMKLTLEEGSTFFYIAEKLAEDESFEIETSTMVIGIRGTSGYILASEDGPEAITITSGTVSVYCNKTGETYEVNAGQKFAVFKMDGEWITGFQDIGGWGLPSEAVDIILSGGDLLEEVVSATGWAEEVSIDAGNFPDDTFREYISANYDPDGNGILDITEIASVDRICFRWGEDARAYFPTDCIGNVRSLKGIELFPNLRELFLEHQDLTELDVSHNPELISLDTFDCGITYLDISHNIALLERINTGDVNAVSVPASNGGRAVMYSDNGDGGRLLLSYDEGDEVNTGDVILIPPIEELNFY
ncbi:MAG: FecR family protein [Lachnospiraceae bacterium]|nr:FecR family protein [Lachnospiraceae bacterium]